MSNKKIVQKAQSQQKKVALVVQANKVMMKNKSLSKLLIQMRYEQ